MKNLFKLSAVLAVVVLTLSGCNCFKKMAKNQDDVKLTCTPEVLVLNNGKVEADITPIGYVPKAEDICIDGLADVTLDTIKELLTVDKASWLEDVENIKAFYAQVGDRVPTAMYDELAALEARLKA